MALVRPGATTHLAKGPWFNTEYGCPVIEQSTASYDNFYTRILNGFDVFDLPAGQITTAHLQVAKVC